MGQEMCGQIGNNLGHRNGNKRFKEILETIPREHSADSLQEEHYTQ